MANVKTKMMKAAMAGLYHSGVHRLLAPYTQGAGVIFTLHRVRPAPNALSGFAPNRILEVTPDFLESVLDQVEAAALDVVSMDEAAERLRTGQGNRFVSFTFDDGYRDLIQHAFPLFRRRGLPFTLYIPTNYPDGRGVLWWDGLEAMIAYAPDQVAIERDGAPWYLPTSTASEKAQSFERAYWWLRSCGERTQRHAIEALAKAQAFDLAAQCRASMMTWDEIRTLASETGATIGVHTKDHLAVAKLSEAEAMDQMVGSADRIETELGARPAHFAFPYGDPGSAGARDFALAQRAGFNTAVTTRKGMLYPGHKDHLTGLPRVSLNGDYQSLTYTALYLSGAPFALWNGFQHVDAA